MSFMSGPWAKAANDPARKSEKSITRSARVNWGIGSHMAIVSKLVTAGCRRGPTATERARPIKIRFLRPPVPFARRLHRNRPDQERPGQYRHADRASEVFPNHGVLFEIPPREDVDGEREQHGGVQDAVRTRHRHVAERDGLSVNDL